MCVQRSWTALTAWWYTYMYVCVYVCVYVHARLRVYSAPQLPWRRGGILFRGTSGRLRCRKGRDIYLYFFLKKNPIFLQWRTALEGWYGILFRDTSGRLRCRKGRAIYFFFKKTFHLFLLLVASFFVAKRSSWPEGRAKKEKVELNFFLKKKSWREGRAKIQCFVVAFV